MRRNLLGGAILACAALACSGDSTPASGLVLGLQLDLTVPEDTDHVAVFIALIKDGRRVNQPPAELTSITRSEVSFVAELVLESHDPNDKVQVRFVAYDAAGKVRAMREARSQLPASGIKLLRMPLLWINDQRVVDTAAGASPASAGVDLRELDRQDLTDDVFSRLSDGCPPEYTRGNDGLCRSIDVAGDELADGTSETAAPACLDLRACFHGPEVRSFALGASGNCELPIHPTAGTTKPALVLTGPSTGGYPLGDAASAAKVRPIDGLLYDYDAARSVIRLGAALCEKVERDRIPTALVSAKCEPKDTDVPVCGARNQRTGPARPTNAGVFVPAEPDGGLADAGPDADSGPQLPPSIHAAMPLDFDTVFSFAARGGASGKLWVLGSQVEVERVMVAPWSAPGARIEVVPAPSYGPFDRGQLSIDQQGAAYIVANAANGDGTYNWALGTGAEGTFVLPIRACAVEGDCSNPSATSCSFAVRGFAVGDQGAETVAYHAVSVGGATPIARAVAMVQRGTQPGCFEPRQPMATQYFQTPGTPQRLFPAATIGGELLASLQVLNLAGTTTSYLLRPGAAAVSGTPLPTAGAFEHIASFGDGLGLMSTPDTGGSTRFTLLSGFAAGTQTTSPYESVSELFGGPGVACMRARSHSDAPVQVLCQLQVGEALVQVVPRLDGEDQGGDIFRPFDPHVYSDAEHLYVGQHCAHDGKFAARGVPWAALRTVVQVEDAFAGICGGDIDAGAR